MSRGVPGGVDEMADLLDSLLARLAALERASGSGGGGEAETGRFILGGWTVAPSGFLLMGTTVTGGAALHADLAAMFPSWVSGADLVLPSVTGASIIGGVTPGVVSGSMTLNLTVAQLPSHDHSISHDHASFDTAPSGGHEHNAGFLTTNAGSGTNADLARPDGFSASSTRDITRSNGAHVHAIDVPAFTGTSGDTGSGADIDITGRNLTVRVAVKT